MLKNIKNTWSRLSVIFAAAVCFVCMPVAWAQSFAIVPISINKKPGMKKTSFLKVQLENPILVKNEKNNYFNALDAQQRFLAVGQFQPQDKVLMLSNNSDEDEEFLHVFEATENFEKQLVVQKVGSREAILPGEAKNNETLIVIKRDQKKPIWTFLQDNIVVGKLLFTQKPWQLHMNKKVDLAISEPALALIVGYLKSTYDSELTLQHWIQGTFLTAAVPVFSLPIYTAVKALDFSDTFASFGEF
jgi:hypothetical protein